MEDKRWCQVISSTRHFVYQHKIVFNQGKRYYGTWHNGLSILLLSIGERETKRAIEQEIVRARDRARDCESERQSKRLRERETDRQTDRQSK
jgi:hypothetical protein